MRRSQLFAVTSTVEGEALSAAASTARGGRTLLWRRFLRRGARLWRRLGALFAGAARIQEAAAAAADLDAAATIFLLALGADQRANPVGLAAHHIQRVEARDFDVELGIGVLVEQLERLARPSRLVSRLV